MLRSLYCIKLLFCVSGPFTQPVLADVTKSRQALETALKNPFDDAAFKAYLTTLPKVRHPLASELVFYIVEGDIPMSEEQVRTHLISRATTPAPAEGQKPELTVMFDAGQAAFWKESGKRKLKYAVSKASFPDAASYEKTVKDMSEAAEDWVAICADCGLSFEHVKTADSIETPLEYMPMLDRDDLRFVVLFSNIDSAIAFAFFPNYPVFNRSLVVGPQYFEMNGDPFTRRGVLRHEIGHILGYRHEHIRGVQGCALENDKWKPLTEYDGNSVMHYPCGPSAARGDLVLTDIDKKGHKALYGPNSPFARSER